MLLLEVIRVAAALVAMVDDLEQQVGVAADHVDQVVGAHEGHGEAVLRRLDAQPGRQVGLAHARGPQQQHHLLAAHELGGGQQVDPALVDAVLEGEVEGVQGLAPRQAGELEVGAQAALLARLLLLLTDQVQEPRQAQFLLDGPLQQLGQALGGPLQAQLREQGQLALRSLAGGRHQLRLPARSTSAAQPSRGRVGACQSQLRGSTI